MADKPRVGSETIPYDPVARQPDMQPVNESQIGGLEHLLEEVPAKAPETPEEKREAWKKAFLEVQHTLAELRRRTAQQEAERNAFVQAMPEEVRDWALNLIRLDEDRGAANRTQAGPAPDETIPPPEPVGVPEMAPAPVPAPSPVFEENFAEPAAEQFSVGDLVEFKGEIGWRVDKVVGKDGKLIEIGRMELDPKGREIYKREIVGRQDIRPEPR